MRTRLHQNGRGISRCCLCSDRLLQLRCLVRWLSLPCWRGQGVLKLLRSLLLLRISVPLDVCQLLLLEMQVGCVPCGFLGFFCIRYLLPQIALLEHGPLLSIYRIQVRKTCVQKIWSIQKLYTICVHLNHKQLQQFEF